MPATVTHVTAYGAVLLRFHGVSYLQMVPLPWRTRLYVVQPIVAKSSASVFYMNRV